MTIQSTDISYQSKYPELKNIHVYCLYLLKLFTFEYRKGFIF